MSVKAPHFLKAHLRVGYPTSGLSLHSPSQTKTTTKKIEMHMNVDSVHLQLAHLPLQPILNNTGERCYSYVKFWADLRKTDAFLRMIQFYLLFTGVHLFSLNA